MYNPYLTVILMFLHLLLYFKIVNFEFAQNQHLDFMNYSENKFII